MKGNKLYATKIFKYLIVSLLFILLSYEVYILYGSHKVIYFFTGSGGDSFRLGGNIVRDLFYWHYGISGFSFMPRPAFFPNLLAQALVVPWVDSPFLSNMIYSVVMLCFLFVTCFLLLDQTRKILTIQKSNIYPLSCIEVLIFCLLFFNIIIFVVTSSQQLSSLYTTYHLENLLNTILYFCFVFRYLRKPSKYYLFFIILMTFLGVMSNILFVITAFLPVWIGLFFLTFLYNYISVNKFVLWTFSHLLALFLCVLIRLLPMFFRGNLYIFSSTKAGISHNFLKLFHFGSSELSVEISSYFWLLLCISFLILFLVVINNYLKLKKVSHNECDGAIAPGYLTQFVWMVIFLSGGLNIILAVMANKLLVGRYIVVGIFILPLMALFFIYLKSKFITKLLYATLSLLSLSFFNFKYTPVINYGIYLDRNPRDGSLSYDISECLSYYAKKGYLFKDGLSDYWRALSVGYRNNIGSYLLSVAVPPFLSNGFNLFRGYSWINNVYSFINRPSAKNIHDFNYIVFADIPPATDNLSVKYIPSAVNFYGKPNEILSCGSKIKIAYYGTESSQRYLNKVIYDQLTCKNKDLNSVVYDYYLGILDRVFSHKLGFYFKSIFEIDKKKERIMVEKLQNYVGCNVVNNYLNKNPNYKKQIDAL